MESNLVRIMKNIDNKLIISYCDNAFDSIGKQLLDYISYNIKNNDSYNMCENFYFGFSGYKVINCENKYIVFSYDYNKKMYTYDISAAFSLKQKQDEFLKNSGIVPEYTTYDKLVMVQKSAFKSNRIYLQKLNPAFDDDSGFYFCDINNIENTSKDDYILLKAHDILKYNEDIIKVFSLPAGYITIANQNGIENIVDTHNNLISFE